MLDRLPEPPYPSLPVPQCAPGAQGAAAPSERGRAASRQDGRAMAARLVLMVLISVAVWGVWPDAQWRVAAQDGTAQVVVERPLIGSTTDRKSTRLNSSHSQISYA